MTTLTATQAQLRCAARASLGSVYYVQFTASLDRRYQRIYSAMQRERSHADAIAWLDTRGLLGKLPKFDPTRSPNQATARAIEAACGPEASGILKPRGVTITPMPRTFFPDGRDAEALICVTNAAEATGYPMGFIGNELYRTK